jgi:hypothetical protein
MIIHFQTLSRIVTSYFLETPHSSKYSIKYSSAESSLPKILKLKITTIADISVAIGAELIKTGAPARSERNAK